jgi:hypothetical protein
MKYIVVSLIIGCIVVGFWKGTEITQKMLTPKAQKASEVQAVETQKSQKPSDPDSEPLPTREIILTKPEQAIRSSEDSLLALGAVTQNGVVSEIGPGYVRMSPLPDGVIPTTDQVPSSEVVRISGTVEGPGGVIEAALLSDGRICRLGSSIGEGRIVAITAARIEVARPDGGLHVMHTGASLVARAAYQKEEAALSGEASASPESGTFAVKAP